MELLDLVDINGNSLGKTVERGNCEIKEGEYIVITVVYLKSNDKYLLQLTSKEKGNVYAVTGGHVPHGLTSREQTVVECKEELGLDLDIDRLEYLGVVYRKQAMFTVYLYEDDNLINEKITLQEEEVADAFWLTKEEIDSLIEKDLVRESTCKSYNKFIK